MLGVCYYPEHWPENQWKTDAERMRQIGISYVRIGEFAWSRLEPSRNDFHFEWLDRAINTLHEAGLQIVLGTPTATPPKWLMDEHPSIAPVDEHGRVRGFGSRRHYSFSSEIWIKETRRIVELVTQRYGLHPAIVGWQTDNEYGCHDTTLSWGPEDLKAFKQWLRMRYQSVDQLNEAWGNVFWSMELRSFDDVALPNLTVTEANPAAKLDFWRFQSDQVASYDRLQCEIIRTNSPGRWITHNFMGFVSDFDHWAIADNLDLASWDSYPIGFVEKFPFSEDERNRWAETSHPDIAAFHHDLYRGVGKGRFWVMEQQPGPVNWAPWNPVPRPNMVRLWTWEAFAHGAEVVSYFRWRQAPFAQEQMHAGLNLSGLDELSAGGLEAQVVGQELKTFGPLPKSTQAPVALVYDYATYWATTIQPQGKDFRYEELAFRWYEAIRRLGLDVDFVRPGASLEGYQLVLVPCLMQVSEDALRAFSQANGKVIYGPRSGSRDRHFRIPDGLAPGSLADLTGVRVTQVGSLRPGLSRAVTGYAEGTGTRWEEYLDVKGDVLSSFDDGRPALTRSGNHLYLATWADETLLQSIFLQLCKEANLNTVILPSHVRMRRQGDIQFVFNYGPQTYELEQGKKFLLGSSDVEAGGVSAWRVALG